MQQCCLEPSVITYNAAITVCEKAKQPGVVFERREVMPPNCLEPKVITQCILLQDNHSCIEGYKVDRLCSY